MLRRAAEHLTPTVLELGGKSPCIVDCTANLRLAAKRIVFGKYLNCGQTCVAPDYMLCEASINLSTVDNFGEICRETLQIAPTVMDAVTWEDPVMQEEIFGPILPVLTVDSFEDIYPLLAVRPKPLALYLFSENRARIRAVMERCAYGGGCVNDTIIHLATSEMGFGGVGESGMGGLPRPGGASRPSPTAKAWWTKRPGWTCPCATSPTTGGGTRSCCGCFCGEFLSGEPSVIF